MPATTSTTRPPRWRYAGRTRGAHGRPLACDACGHAGLHLAYLLHDTANRVWQWVGADCALRAVPKAEAAIRRDRIAQAREKAGNELIRAVLQLGYADPEFPAERFLFSHRKHHGWTPAQARVIAWRAREADVRIDPRWVRVRLRRGREREQVATMPEWQYRDLATFLTPPQARACERLRGTAAQHSKDDDER